MLSSTPTPARMPNAMINPLAAPARPSGLYAVIDLDGAPTPARDAEALGLSPGLPAPMEGFDELQPHMVDRCDDGDRLCIVVGPAAPADWFGAPIGSAKDLPPAAAVLAGIDRFGADAAWRVHGEWSALVWQRSRGRLQLLVSVGVRDPIFYQRRGSSVAVAPGMRFFHRLAWQGRALDADGLLLQLGRQRLRRALGSATFLEGVHSVEAGALVTIARDGRVDTRRASPPAAQTWRGSFDEAVAQASDLLRAGIDSTLAGHGHAMVLTSGGLDSSTLAWLACERRAGRPLTLLSSVAAAGSGLADERGWSAMVAAHLGVPIVWVTPAQATSPFRPSPRAMAEAAGPLFGPRHYLYDALYDSAIAGGASLLFDGLAGEASISALYPHRPWRERARRWWKDQRKTTLAVRQGWPKDAFHVRLAPHRLAALPAAWHEQWATPEEAQLRHYPGGRWGFSPSVFKTLRLPTTGVAGRLRIAYPFRDIALLRRFAGYPIDYLRHGGHDRAFARAMMRGHLPDAVRLRPKGTAFSPDYAQRLRHHAEAARSRLSLLRAAALDEWFDLPWLDMALGRIGAGAATGVDASQAQLTMAAAEYLLWLRDPVAGEGG